MLRSLCICAFIFSHIIGGLLILLAIGILFLNFAKFKNLDPDKLIVICLFFSIVITIHGISQVKVNKMIRKMIKPENEDFTVNAPEVN